jgi:hypothetical protein
MTFKITKLDRRYNGNKWFKYVAEVGYNYSRNRDDRIGHFKKAREWLWSTFGPSCELNYVTIVPNTDGSVVKESWAWESDFGRERLYLRSDQELELFTLKWQ